MYVVATAYTIFVLGEIQGVLLLVPMFFNTDQEMDTYWMKLRVVYGVVWITIMARLLFGWYAG
jgi:hypothetical protein